MARMKKLKRAKTGDPFTADMWNQLMDIWNESIGVHHKIEELTGEVKELKRLKGVNDIS